MQLQLVLSQEEFWLLEVKTRILKYLGGASVAFKNAVVGGVILTIIETVANVITQISIRR